MDPVHRKVLQTNRTNIIKNIANPLDVVDLLYQRQVFNESMKQEIEAEKTQILQTRKILDTITYRGPTAYNLLYECLVDSDNNVVAEILRPEYRGSYPRDGCGDGFRGHAVHTVDDILPAEWPNEAIMTADIVVRQCNAKSDHVKYNWLSDRVYSMKKRCRGRCLIISNKIFNGPLMTDDKGKLHVRLAPRYGTEKDVADLKALFEQLHFLVDEKKDLTAVEMNALLIAESSRAEHRDAECFICVICSHGTNDGVYGVDGETISLVTVTEHFNGRHCPALSDKPKLFFIQACHGNVADRPNPDNFDANIKDITSQLKETLINTPDSMPFSDQMDASKENPAPTLPTETHILMACATHPDVADRPNPDNFDANIKDITSQLKETLIKTPDSKPFSDQMDASKENPAPTLPTETHILMACATHPGYVSLRNQTYGSWFIQAIVYVFQKFACTEDIFGLLTLVNDLVARGRTQLNGTGPRNVMQASVFNSSLTRKFMFFPGVNADTEF